MGNCGEGVYWQSCERIEMGLIRRKADSKVFTCSICESSFNGL